jgi:hypothetical protein
MQILSKSGVRILPDPFGHSWLVFGNAVLETLLESVHLRQVMRCLYCHHRLAGIFSIASPVFIAKLVCALYHRC